MDEATARFVPPEDMDPEGYPEFYRGHLTSLVGRASGKSLFLTSLARMQPGREWAGTPEAHRSAVIRVVDEINDLLCKIHIALVPEADEG